MIVRVELKHFVIDDMIAFLNKHNDNEYDIVESSIYMNMDNYIPHRKDFVFASHSEDVAKGITRNGAVGYYTHHTNRNLNNMVMLLKHSKSAERRNKIKHLLYGGDFIEGKLIEFIHGKR